MVTISTKSPKTAEAVKSCMIHMEGKVDYTD